MTEIVFPGVSNRVGNSRIRRGGGGGGGVYQTNTPWNGNFRMVTGLKHNCPPWKGGMDIFWD